MRVSKISVKNLFNTFDHTVPLKLDGRVTIIHGLNGFGKTTLLRMVQSLCSARYSDLQAIPFLEFRLDFDNGTAISVTKETTAEARSKKQRRKRSQLLIRHFKGEKEAEQFQPPSEIDPGTLEYIDDVIRRFVPSISRTSPHDWLLHSTGEMLSTEQVVERFADQFPDSVRSFKHEPRWMEDLRKSVHVRLIETQRLMAHRSQVRHREVDGSWLLPAIINHSNEMANNCA